MPEDANDETQLLKATAQGRCILTFNIKDFTSLALQYPKHGGIILAAQSSWNLSESNRISGSLAVRNSSRRLVRTNPLVEPMAVKASRISPTVRSRVEAMQGRLER